MRAQEFIREDEKKTRFADGYLVFSDHFEDRLRERNISKAAVFQLLEKLERRRSVDLIRMPFITFTVKSPNLSLAFSKQLDKSGNTAYVVATVRSDLRGGEDEDVIYLEEDSATADQVLKYVKRAHAPEEFNIEYSITDHPRWELKNIPVSQLKLDPDGEEQDPYRRVNWVDYDKVQELMPQITSVLKTMPIVVDSQGWIIDGNHRATAAAEAGLKSVPAYVPAEVAEAVNPDITGDEYFNEPTENVRMGDFVFNARTFTGGLGQPNARGLQIRAYDPKNLKSSIGSADFIVKSDKKGNQWLESDDTEVNDEYRGKGVAAMMYAFAKSLGNDIKDSPYKSKAGADMWSKWGSDAKHLVREQDIEENFADGKVKGKSRPGRVKRAGASCAGSVSDLRAKAKKYGGERGKMYHWCANMKAGRKK